MVKPKTLDERIKDVQEKARLLINKGVIGTDSMSIQRTLEMHERVKALLEELDRTLEKDIPKKLVIEKISSVEKELDIVNKQVSN